LLAGVSFLLLQLKKRGRVATGIAALVILGLPWVPDEYSERVASIFADEEKRDESANSRPVLWGIAMRIWQDHPIAGVGLRNFSPVKETYSDRVDGLVKSEEMHQLIFNQPRVTHGLYPGLMAETGFIGTALFVILLFRNVRCRISMRADEQQNQAGLLQQAKGAQAGLVGFAVAAIFGDFQYIEMLYLQLFFIGGVWECLSRARAESSPDASRRNLLVYDKLKSSATVSGFTSCLKQP
jgi:O-antigen ligase